MGGETPTLILTLTLTLDLEIQPSMATSETPTSTEEVDRISALPDEILHSILSFIPDTEDVAMTSVLSKRFQHLWAHHPTIRLGAYKPQVSYGLCGPRRSFSDSAIAQYIESVDRCLALYRSPTLQSLDLRLFSQNPEHAQSASRWLIFAALRSILNIRLVSEPDATIPGSIYNCRTLVSLDVTNCKFPAAPLDFDGFPVLKSLKISRSHITDDVLTALLSGCPSLRSLTLDSCNYLRVLVLRSSTFTELKISSSSSLEQVWIDAPNLLVMDFEGNIANLFLKEARCLLDARIRHYFSDPGREMETYAKWVRPVMDLRHVSKSLEVDVWFFQFVLPKTGPEPIFKNLKELYCCIQWVNASMLDGLVMVLAHCPILEQLCVDFTGSRLDMVDIRRNYLQYKSLRQEGDTATSTRARPEYLDNHLRIGERRSKARPSFAPDDFEAAFSTSEVMLEKDLEDDKEYEVWDKSEAIGVDFGNLTSCLKTSLKIIIVKAFYGTPNEMKMLEYLLGNAGNLQNLTIGDGLMRAKEEIECLLAYIPKASLHVQIHEMEIRKEEYDYVHAGKGFYEIDNESLDVDSKED